MFVFIRNARKWDQRRVCSKRRTKDKITTENRGTDCRPPRRSIPRVLPSHNVMGSDRSHNVMLTAEFTRRRKSCFKTYKIGITLWPVWAYNVRVTWGWMDVGLTPACSTRTNSALYLTAPWPLQKFPMYHAPILTKRFPDLSSVSGPKSRNDPILLFIITFIWHFCPTLNVCCLTIDRACRQFCFQFMD